MEGIKHLNQIIDYIDEHICEDIDMLCLATMAGCSSNYLQRVFAFVAGISLSEYIRRRRLTLAALDLQKSNIKIIDLAMKYGYGSPDAFTRAFQRIHGITPTLARSKDMMLKSFSKLVFDLTLNGEKPLNYKFVRKEAFELIGIGLFIDSDHMTEDIQFFWQESYSNGTCKRLYEYSNGERLFDVVAYSEDSEDSEGRTSFHIAYENNAKVKDMIEPFEILNIPELDWVIFTLEETLDIAEASMEKSTQYTEALWNKVYSEWLPNSGYIDGTPIIEVFNANTIELWIPVVRDSSLQNNKL